MLYEVITTYYGRSSEGLTAFSLLDDWRDNAISWKEISTPKNEYRDCITFWSRWGLIPTGFISLTFLQQWGQDGPRFVLNSHRQFRSWVRHPFGLP